MDIFMFILLLLTAVICFVSALIVNDVRLLVIGVGLFAILSLILFFVGVETNKVLDKSTTITNVDINTTLTSEDFNFQTLNADNDIGAMTMAYILMGTFFVGLGFVFVTRWSKG